MWYLIFSLIGAALTLVLHELSHCCLVWVGGGTVTSFKPWPHFETFTSAAGTERHFYFGRMTYDTARPPNRKWFLLAPLLKSLLFFVFWSIMGWFWHPLWCLAGWEVTDWSNWLQGYIRKSQNDGGQYRASNAT